MVQQYAPAFLHI